MSTTQEELELSSKFFQPCLANRFTLNFFDGERDYSIIKVMSTGVEIDLFNKTLTIHIESDLHGKVEKCLYNIIQSGKQHINVSIDPNPNYHEKRDSTKRLFFIEKFTECKASFSYIESRTVSYTVKAEFRNFQVL